MAGFFGAYAHLLRLDFSAAARLGVPGYMDARMVDGHPSPAGETAVGRRGSLRDRHDHVAQSSSRQDNPCQPWQIQVALVHPSSARLLFNKATADRILRP